jgi:hypothetical protein
LLGILDDESIKHKELEFDKVIPIEHQFSAEKRDPHDKEIDESVEEQHPFDLSFIEQINNDNYISDGEKKLKGP